MIKEISEQILFVAKVLYINGETTNQIIRELKLLGSKLNLQIEIFARWGELKLNVQDCQTGEQYSCSTRADPTGVQLGRVSLVIKALRDFYSQKISFEQAMAAITEAAKQEPSATWLFTLAATMGAIALAILYGLNQWVSVFIIILSASLGGVGRRYLGSISDNIFIQPFFAALIAGIIAGIAIQTNISPSMRFFVVCPCMILVPGPHFLNGMLDLIRGHIHLGLSRMCYAILIVLAICVGLLIGLQLLGTNLAVESTAGVIVPIWQDMLAAGVAVAAYSVFYTSPVRFIAWPILVGMIGHMLRWIIMVKLGASLTVATLIACLFIGCVITWISHRKHIPFVAASFAAVVSMLPGLFLFRMSSGLVQLSSGPDITFNILSTTMYDGISAVLITLSIGLGLLAPKLIMDQVFSNYFRKID